MPLLAAAVTDVDERIVEMEEKRDATVRTGRVLDLLTFGLAGGAAYQALSSHHSQSVRNLAFGAGATYAGGSLFAPLDVANVYHNGVTALACVANRSAVLRTAVSRYRTQVASDDAAKLPGSLATGDCDPDATDMAAALAIQDKVKRVLVYSIGADAEQASRVRQAANSVVTAVNREILKRSNNPESILAAAKGLVAGTTGTVITPKTFQVTSTRGATRCSAEINQRIRDFTTSYTEIDKVVTGALNAMAALDTSCVLEPVTAEALALSQEEVAVTKDAIFNVLVSGGRPPYSISQVGSASKDISVQLVAPRTIVVTGLSTIKGATGPFTFQVKDNSVITSPKTLKVSTK